MRPKILINNIYILTIVFFIFLSINISFSPLNISVFNKTFAESKDSKSADKKESKSADKKESKSEEQKKLKSEVVSKKQKNIKKNENKKIKNEKKAEKKAKKILAKEERDKFLLELKISFEKKEISKIERDRKIKEIIDMYLQKIKIINSKY